MNGKYLNFIPDHLAQHVATHNTKRAKEHPWGYILPTHSAKTIMQLVVGFSVCTDETSPSCFRIRNDLIHGNFPVDLDLPAPSCLVSSCSNYNQSSSTNSYAPDVLTTWITFDLDCLHAFRRYSAVSLVDQLARSAVQRNDDWPSLPTSNHQLQQLSEQETAFLQARLGAPLTALVNLCTEAPFAQDADLTKAASLQQSTTITNEDCSSTFLIRLRSKMIQFVCRSYTIRLVHNLLTVNGYTRRLRALLPRQIVDDTMVTIDRPTLQNTVCTAYTGSPRHPKSSKLLSNLFPSTDPILILIGSLHLLFLLVSLFAPFRSSVTGTTGKGLSDPCAHTRGHHHLSLETSSLFAHSVSDLNCTRFDTFPWFLSNVSYAQEESNQTGLSPWMLIDHLKQHKLINSTVFENMNHCWFSVVKHFTLYFTCKLARLLSWLESGDPAGLKINIHMARLMGHFFLYHLLAWYAYTGYLIYCTASLIIFLQDWTQIYALDYMFYANLYTSACMVLSTIYLSTTSPRSSKSHSDLPLKGNTIPSSAILLTYTSAVFRFTLALIGSLLIDLQLLMTVHLSTFYIYTHRLLSLQVRTIVAAWRLCRNASKWNPLRKRVDTVSDMYTMGLRPVKLNVCTSDTTPGKTDVDTTEIEGIPFYVETKHDIYLDRLFLGTLLGLAVSLCLLPTTLAFYLTFSAIRLAVLTAQNTLKRCILFILDAPFSAMLAWVLHWKRSRTNLIIHTPIHQPTGDRILSIKLVRPDLHEAYENARLLHNCDDILDPILGFRTTLWHLCILKQI